MCTKTHYFQAVDKLSQILKQFSFAMMKNIKHEHMKAIFHFISKPMSYFIITSNPTLYFKWIEHLRVDETFVWIDKKVWKIITRRAMYDNL